MRIIDEYRQSVSKPKFEITENNIRIVLPVTETDESYLLEDELIIYKILKDGVELSRGELDKKSGFSKSKTLRVINHLADKSIVKKTGRGPGTTYTLK